MRHTNRNTKKLNKSLENATQQLQLLLDTILHNNKNFIYSDIKFFSQENQGKSGYLF